MTVDWLTVAAQIVNFLILVWLLKRFLYQPVIDAMARREQRIADRLDEAAARQQEATAEGEKYRSEREALERRRDEVLADALEEAEGLKRQMLDAGRQEAAAARAGWLRAAAHEQTEFLANLRRESAGMVQAAARKALTDLAGVELETAMAERFVERLEVLDDADRQALASSGGPVTVTTAFELAPALRERISRVVRGRLGPETPLEYRCSGELICGVELTRGGRRLSWHLADYMDRLAERVDAAFQPALAEATSDDASAAAADAGSDSAPPADGRRESQGERSR